MEIVNATPHDLVIMDDAGNVVKTYATSDMVARVSTQVASVSDIDGVPAVETTFGAVTGIPDADGETVYIVSSLVRSASDRVDLVSPDTGPGSVVRDDSGRIVGVKRFTR